MQRFFPSAIFGSAVVVTPPPARFGELAKGQPNIEEASARPILKSRAAEAGVYPQQTDDTDAPVRMYVSGDIQNLLALSQPREAPQAAPDPLALQAPGMTEMERATDLFDQRLAEARRWLALHDTVSKLDARGLRVADVEVQLKYAATAGLRKLGIQAARGEELVHLVPTAHYLFSLAVRDADMALLARPAITHTTTRATTPVTTTPATTALTTVSVAAAIKPKEAPVVAPNRVIDLVRRERSLQNLAKFQENYFRALPQLANRHLHGLYDFMKGDIQFLLVTHMAATFPIATAIEFSRSPPHYVPTYPTDSLKPALLNRGFIRGILAVVARDETTPTVKICSDGYTWQKTAVYTDDVVEAAKLEMWKTILAAGTTIYELVLKNTWF
jgi:hypothetical protein